MKQKRTFAPAAATTGKQETFRIVNEAGETVTSFTLGAERKDVTIYIERPGILEAPVKRLEREAWSYYEALMMTLDKIDAINHAAALALFEQMFTNDE